MTGLLGFLSGEYMLKSKPNGGDIVLLRAIHSTFFIYLMTILLHEITKPNAILTFSQEELISAVHKSIPWLGAIFAATYATFYTRYSSQWTYLANTYNQFMAVKSVQNDHVMNLDHEAAKALNNWMAGFVSDCFTLHLDRKPIFKGIIENLMKDEKIKELILGNFEGEEKQEFIRRHST